MSSGFQKTSSQLFLTLFIGVIVISFMFSGPFMDSGAPDSVGSVGEHSIRFREFNGEVERQQQFYSRFMKQGKPLTSSEMKQFKIYDNAIKSLVFQKLRFILADEMGIAVSKDEIIADIKNTEFFKTNGQFDINRYKGLLAANRITPEDYEMDSRNRLKATKLQDIMKAVPFSDKLKEDLNKLYNMQKAVTTYTINSAELKKTIKITDAEVNKFLEKEVNMARTKSIFEQRKASLSQKEQVKARHILFKIDDKTTEAKALKKAQDLKKKLTKKNFSALAKKNTDEIPGKSSGGDLNWVSKGMMVKPFEDKLFSMKKGEISEPVKTQFGYHIIYAEDKKEAKEAKFEDHKNAIAKESLQNERDVKELMDKAVAEVKTALESGKSINKLKNKYKISVQAEKVINRLEGDQSNFDLKPEELNKIFSSDDKLHVSNTGTKATFIVVNPAKATEKKEFNVTSTQNIMAQKVSQALLEKLQESYPYKQNKAAVLPN